MNSSSSSRLAEFLVWLASDDDRIDRYNTSESTAVQMMRDHYLDEETQEALLSRDATKIHGILSRERSRDLPFILPFGPVRGTTGSPYPLDGPPIRFFEADPTETAGGTYTVTAAPSRTTARKRPAVKKRKAAARKKTPKSRTTARARRPAARKRTSRKK